MKTPKRTRTMTSGRNGTITETETGTGTATTTRRATGKGTWRGSVGCKRRGENVHQNKVIMSLTKLVTTRRLLHISLGDER